ncbi:TonB-dependent receptor [Lewinellaceae bacterium SD302]|nr:TonB-dependent receptor [Lewinellaceae bacterium SD302]
MKATFTLLSLIFTFFSLQAHHVHGVVEDRFGDPVIGAYVSKTNSRIHAHTDEFGKFAIEGLESGDTLLISLLGYENTYLIIDDIEKMYAVTLEAASYDLGQVTVNQSSQQFNVVSAIDIKLTPVQNSQEILRSVPGLFIGQHAGGGKAEQLFLRGFDIDHGTDVALSVDGMPVNMVSHAHGQGYADLHFVIPETVERIDFGKGPYYADQGNFNTAGYVGFQTKNRIRNSQIGIEIGDFGFQRAVGMFKLIDTTNQSAYIATEFLINDGPFESPQNFVRNNFMGKYNRSLRGGSQLSVMASHFTSQWDASGQIPVREVEAGRISRFGAIDDTEGGQTSRTNVNVTVTNVIDDNTYVRTNAYWSHYDFELFSNFTFFLEDPVNGDQIRQFENRNIYGLNSTWNRSSTLGGKRINYRGGIGFRADRIEDNELSRTANRKETLEQIQFGDVDEKNMFAFASASIELGDLIVQPVLRYDYFQFNYVDRLLTQYDNQRNVKGALLPKLNLTYEFSPNFQLYAKSGIGFHSNDTRVVLDRDEDQDILPLAYGADLGADFKPADRLIVSAALWYLFLEQEFVYVGDAGIVEPSGQTRRQGIDLTARYQINDFLFANGDFTYTHARSVEEPEGENLIPLAPIITASGGLNLVRPNYRASLRVRHLGDRPANEDDSINAPGYTIFDLNGSYDLKRLTLGFAIENLFDVEWNETQFATESRLRFEDEPVEEIHFTPGVPFFLKGIVRYNF